MGSSAQAIVSVTLAVRLLASRPVSCKSGLQKTVGTVTAR